MIPHILWQTAKTVGDLDNKNCKQLINTWATRSPSIDLRFMDDEGCDSFIRRYFSDEVYSVYQSLPLGIMRADFWRVAVIYIHGGIYSDVDVYCAQNIAPLLEGKDIVILEEHPNSGSISNYCFAAKPGHPLLKQTIDAFVTNYRVAFKAESEMVVQNFGMALFQECFDSSAVEITPYHIAAEYVKHQCHGSWRDSEHEYRNKRFMKPITFFTTFNQAGYDLYGKKWIETFIANVATDRNNITARIYAHNVKGITINHPQITVIDYDTAIPQHSAWKSNFLNRSGHSGFTRNNTIRFSHKGFVIQHALDTIKTGYAIWLDGDCVMHKQSYDNFPNILLEKECIACQVEHAGHNHHVESGVLLFDVENPDIEKFKQQFKRNYEVDQVLTMGEPYDGFIVYRSLINSGVSFNNLNEKYGVGGIQSCPTLTFLHPEIKSRFTHNIGLTGKSQYEDWDSLKFADRTFATLACVGVMTDKQVRVHKLRQKKRLLSNM
jgi:Glycosyltransferase sugar-binding region containing DXD motif